MQRVSLKFLLKNEISGWKAWEVVWLWVALLLVALPTGLSGARTGWPLVCACCGVVSVVLAGKGKLGCYLFGGIQRLIYVFISWEACFYGEVMLNGLYFLPMEFYGVYSWYQHMSYQTHEVQKRRMRPRLRGILLVGLILCTIVYGYFLRYLGGRLPFLDSFTTVFSVVALLLTIHRYVENWLLWLSINTVSLGMWLYNVCLGTGNLAIALMWAVYVSNSLLMLCKWQRETKGVVS